MYFSKFPLVNYSYVTNNKVLRKKLATNILKRVGFTEGSKQDKGQFITYDIKDGERPEIIADKLYDDPELHWIVLIFNDIIHPYIDWPMDNHGLDNYIEKKYNGYSLFLSDVQDGHPSTIDFHKNQTVANTLGGVDWAGIYQLGNKRARVKNWDSQYSRLDIEKSNLGNVWSEGEYVVGIGATGQTVVGKIQRVNFHTEAVHHFERQEGLGGTGDYIWLNPIASPENEGQIPVGATGATMAPGNTGTGLYRETAPTFAQTVVGGYMGIDGDNNNNYVITNRQYETRLNDQKKKIKLLDPKYINSAIQEHESLLKVRGLIT